MGSDLFTITNDFQTSRVGLDLVDCAIELGDFAVGGENVCP